MPEYGEKHAHIGPTPEFAIHLCRTAQILRRYQRCGHPDKLLAVEIEPEIKTMSVVETKSRPAWTPFRFVCSLLERAQVASMDAQALERRDHARRDFVLEMMQSHPEAIQHEIGYQNMMQYFSSRF